VGKLVVTIRLPYVEQVIRDIRDYLYPRDESVRIVRTRFRGVAIIESSLDSLEIAKLVLNSPIPGHVLNRVVPIILESKWSSLEDIVRIVRGIPCNPSLVRCRLRGIGGDSACEERLRSSLMMGTDCVLIVEGIDDWVGVYAGPPVYVRLG